MLALAVRYFRHFKLTAPESESQPWLSLPPDIAMQVDGRQAAI